MHVDFNCDPENHVYSTSSPGKCVFLFHFSSVVFGIAVIDLASCGGVPPLALLLHTYTT